MKGIMEKIAKILLNSLLGIVIVAIFFAAYSLIQLSVLDKEYVNYFGYTIFEVESGSMAPTININDLIVVKITDKINKDDIITYKSEGAFITHRVIRKEANKYVTQGDYNNFQDKIVSKKDVIGKIVKIIPKFGVWKKIILSPVVIISISACLLLFSLGFSYSDKKNKKKKEENENIENQEETKEETNEPIIEVNFKKKEEKKEQVKIVLEDEDEEEFEFLAEKTILINPKKIKEKIVKMEQEEKLKRIEEKKEKKKKLKTFETNYEISEKAKNIKKNKKQDN